MTVRVTGLRELQRDLKKIGGDSGPSLRKKLREVAEPVRALAEGKAGSSISHIGPTWSRMKVGVTAKSVYVAPRARRKGGSPRGNLGGLLMDKALDPALKESEVLIVNAVESMLDRIADDHGF